MKRKASFKKIYISSLNYLYKRMGNRSIKIRTDKGTPKRFSRLLKTRKLKSTSKIFYATSNKVRRRRQKTRGEYRSNEKIFYRRKKIIGAKKARKIKLYKWKSVNWFAPIHFVEPYVNRELPLLLLHISSQTVYKIVVFFKYKQAFIQWIYTSGQNKLQNIPLFRYSGVCFMRLNNKFWSAEHAKDLAIKENSQVSLILDLPPQNSFSYLPETSLLSFILNNVGWRLRKDVSLSEKTNKRVKLRYSRLGKRLNSHMHKILFLGYRWHNKWRLWKLKKFIWFIFHSKYRHRRFRKIYKYRPFYNILRGMFKVFTGFSEKDLFAIWLSLRRQTGARYYFSSLVSLFSRTVSLMPKNLAVFLRLAPTLAAAEAFVKSGGFISNGTICADLFQIKPGDIIQVNALILNRVRLMFRYSQWENTRVNVAVLSFFQIDWASMMFMLIKWPAVYEIVAPSFLNERWVRYYIRNFPVSTQRSKKIKFSWKAER